MLRALILAAFIPVNALACMNDPLTTFADKWGVDPTEAVIHTTTDATNGMEVAVFDLGENADPSMRYAVTWTDLPSCTLDAKFGDLPSTLLTMETEVYDR